MRTFVYIAALIFLGMSLSAPAATIYKYRNADGVVSFTDKPTKGAQVLYYGDRYVEQLDTRVRLVARASEKGEVLTVVNDLYAPVEVDIKLKNFVNVQASATNHIHRIVPARSSTPLLELQAQRPGKVQYQHQLRFALSNPKQPQDHYDYPLPWLAGQYKVSQGPGGKFSHQDEKGKHAVDIAMPVGTRVTAARAGVVVSLDQKQREGNGSKAGNYVRVLHDDGTMSVYLHMRHHGVEVKEGQSVAIGDLIGYSGNTGSSTGPHLHFVVQKNVGMKVVSIPFRFNDPAAGMARTPKAGEWLGRSTIATR